MTWTPTPTTWPSSWTTWTCTRWCWSGTPPAAARSPGTSAGHGTARVSKAVLVGAVPPLMLRTDANPAGQPRAVFDAIRHGVESDRAQFYTDLAVPFYGANRPGSSVSEGIRHSFWRLSMQAGLKATYDCVPAVLRDRLHR